MPNTPRPAVTTPPRVLLIGTNEALAEAWARLTHAPDDLHAVGALPARRTEAGTVDEVPMLGEACDLERVIEAEAIDHVLVATPRAMDELTHNLLERARKSGAQADWLAPLADALNGAAALPNGLLNLGALIGREPRPIDRELVRRVVAAQRVLITGAGGSIGSELARLIAEHDPSELVLMERSENALFEIDRELAARFPRVPRRAMLHDVVDAAQTARLLVECAPHCVFHAAAHKHVPMMEDHPGAAITNNVFGTKAVLDGATEAGAGRFVLVSTDKAVRPTSVMGATKRLAELYVQSRAGEIETRCSIVRFGNVLGSACSVLPIWERQIATGGPLTITDERMTRYFMTIPEAAALVIQSAAIEEHDGARVFVLDMGAPIRVIDLAKRLLAQRALRDASDPSVGGRSAVQIRFTGVRPGEKLHEELSYDSESLTPTVVPGVRSWHAVAPRSEEVLAMIRDLDEARARPDRSAIIDVLHACVPEMQPPASSTRTRSIGPFTEHEQSEATPTVTHAA